MGCDIHLVVEVRKGGKWHRALPAASERDPWYVEMAANEKAREIVCAGNAVVRHGTPDNTYERLAAVTWYTDRNYAVFAELAGVRMRFGSNPISQPRGFPSDLSEEVLRLIGERGNEYDILLEPPGPRSDIHSASWLTLEELQAHVWPEEAIKYDFGQRFLPALVALREREGVAASDVRIVFGFDN